MKKTILSLTLLGMLFLNSGCSGTWEGVKSDTSDAWDTTKETIHEATK
jgi:hypothetical protein